MKKYAAIVARTNKILGEYDFPLTLRQIYYRLVAAGVIPNKRSAYNSLSKTLVKARENSEVDDTRIEDRTREVLQGTQGFHSPGSFIDSVKYWFKNMGKEYYANLWQNQQYFLEVWVEKDALSRVIKRAADEYRVTVCPSRGYSSYTYIKRMAVDERFKSVSDKPIVILDFRDHDPSGIQMTEDLQTRFTKYDQAHEVTVERVALTIDQVKEHDLLPNPTKMADPRSAGYVSQFGDECWELDAIEPNELQKLVREAVVEKMDMEQWNEDLTQEENDREELIERLKKARVTV
jgi:hypothetical protein